MSKFTWFLVGGAIGAGAALALAPRTGDETRALVTEKANAFAGEAKDFAAGMPGTAQDAFNSACERGTAVVNDAASKVKGAAGAANDADADELREKIEAARQRIAAQVMENAEKAQAAAADMTEAAAETVEEAAEAVEDAAEDAAEAKHAK